MTPNSEDLEQIIADFWALPFADRRAVLSRLDPSVRVQLKKRYALSKRVEPIDQASDTDRVFEYLSDWLSEALESGQGQKDSRRAHLIQVALQQIDENIQANPKKYTRNRSHLFGIFRRGKRAP